MSDTPKGSFPKSAHLLKHSDFQRVYQQGLRHFSGNMTVFYLRSMSAAEATPMAGEAVAHSCAHLRVGFTVSKALGPSVVRNRLRRRTREAVRRHLSMMQDVAVNMDVVINPKKSLLHAEFAEISAEVERAFGVIRHKCENASAREGRAGEGRGRRGDRRAAQQESKRETQREEQAR